MPEQASVIKRNIVTDPDTIRTAVFNGVITAVRNKFPLEGRTLTAHLKNAEVDFSPLSHQQQKLVVMAKGNANSGLFVDIDIVDNKTGEVIESLKKHRLMNIPYFTNRYTFIVDGSEYLIVNQLRTKSGVYTRVRGNDELEASFNLAKGANFKLILNPETGVFKIDILHSTLPMYGVLKVLGAEDSTIRQALGDKLFDVNKGVTPTQMDRTLNTLYDKLARHKSLLGATADKGEMAQKVRDYFNGTEISPETTQLTLGAAYTIVGYQTILDAAKKILNVYNQDEEVDERDNLEFQKVYSVEDIVREVVEKSSLDFAKIRAKLDLFRPAGTQEDTRKLKAIFSPLHLSKSLRNFLTTSSIARLPAQINPMEIMDSAAIVTRLGEGAISSERAVPDDTRAVNLSYLGVIDPVATPESSKVGIDNRFSIAAIKGSDNEIYKEVRNTKTGKLEPVRVIDLYDKYVGFPDHPYDIRNGTLPGTMSAVYRGKLVKVPRTQLDYQIGSPHDLNTITTNTIPFINGNQANRIVMGAKHLQQALPLKHRDTRLVEAVMPHHAGGQTSTLDILGGFMLPKAPVDGIVEKIDDDFIHVKGEDGMVHKVDYANHLPLATKTMLHSDITVKAGDPVKKGEALADNNFTKDKKLALGKNLKVAYQPYKGLNHEDGIVISESAAQKLTSEHVEKLTITLDKLMAMGKERYTLYYPTNFTSEQLSKLDSDGVVKKGGTLEYGDPIFLILSDNSENRVNQVLGMLHKSLVSKYRDASEVYEGHYPAEVLDVHKAGSTITAVIRVEKPASVGDKLSGSYGNKGVITHIVPDDQMLQDESNDPIDIILTPPGVPGRINPAQILESTLGKIALKTGKPYQIENFFHPDYEAFVRGEMAKHKVKDKETLTDPETGKKIPNIFVGVQHIHKLFKTTDTNFAARGVEGSYDQDDAPVGSGESGPKSLGGMEVNALIAHNARNLLRESTTVRSSKNGDFWRQFQYGGIAHMPNEKKTFNKFLNILKQAGVKAERRGDQLSIGPLTDKDVLEMSSGEITEATRLNAKLEPETNGLFDEGLTGGMNGTKWTHIKLTEPVINPVFEDCVKSLLRMSTRELHQEFKELGGEKLKKRLSRLDLDALLEETDALINSEKVKGDALDKAIKRKKYILALKGHGLSAGEAYMLSVVPVTPPVIRPITVGKSGDKLENDSNILYRDLILQNNTFKDIKAHGLTQETKENRESLYTRVKELAGVIAPDTAHSAQRGVKGALAYIAGDQPKRGFFQRKMIYSKMNLTGRATIIPDPTLGLDQVGIPEDMAWETFRPFILRRLVQIGYPAMKAKTEVEERSDLARKILEEELEHRPMIVNRAPTLWRYSMLAAKPVLRPGLNLQVNSLWESATNMDNDGDAMQIHLPITDEAIEDARQMLPSKLVFSEKKRGALLMAPSQEPIVALYKVTRNLGGVVAGSSRKFKNVGEAWKAYYDGSLKATDLVEIS